MAILVSMGVQTIAMAFLADLFSVNRRLLEDIQYRVRKAEFDGLPEKKVIRAAAGSAGRSASKKAPGKKAPKKAAKKKAQRK